MKRYAVTKDVPAGMSTGTSYDSLEAASEAFGEAAYRTSAPSGTKVTLWDGDEALDRATVTDESKAAYRAETSAALAAIVERANERAAERLSR